jgi:hypothetical protein
MGHFIGVPGSMSAMSAIGEYPIDTNTPAVVLEYDQNVMHQGGLGAVRSLGRVGHTGRRGARGIVGSGRQLTLPGRYYSPGL